MKLILLVLFALGNEARLIEKITDRTLTTETKTTGSSPPVRLTRDAFEEDSYTGSSKEDHMASEEQVSPYTKKVRLFTRSKAGKDEPSSLIRVPRESHEKVDKVKKNTNTSQHLTTKQKSSLVKKPNPKYNEMDYDDDFQMKVSRSPVRVVDSGEHEDEDFNLEDYDFDVNHDEFIGRGKPLEPRTKTKINHHRSSHPSQKQETKIVPQPEEKPQRKAHVSAASHRPISNKKQRAIPDSHRKAGEKEDYYDDTTTTQKVPEKEKARDQDDEFNEDNEESKEFESKSSSVRTIRSPWKLNYMDKFGEQGSYVMSKVLGILPMFPQVPNENLVHQNADTSMDPWPAQA